MNASVLFCSVLKEILSKKSCSKQGCVGDVVPDGNNLELERRASCYACVEQQFPAEVRAMMAHRD